jgi:hypothetical protein
MFPEDFRTLTRRFGLQNVSIICGFVSDEAGSKTPYRQKTAVVEHKGLLHSLGCISV